MACQTKFYGVLIGAFRNPCAGLRGVEGFGAVVRTGCSGFCAAFILCRPGIHAGMVSG